ncbi:MAG TPA: hypothetical protein VMZ91_14655 [Candidatus Paceibacterota bacterium]|nr:hypothetical protein [Candidatus Paceibacterota bacterium]
MSSETITKCDKCKKIMTDFVQVEWRRGVSLNNDGEIELCLDCFGKLFKWTQKEKAEK